MELGSNGIQNKGSGAPPIVPSGVSFLSFPTPSQRTSFVTGDEGDRVQNGWYNNVPPIYPKTYAQLDYTSVNFNFVLKNPLVVNGVSSTTRFVDINGVQTFTPLNNGNVAVIDKLTGLMFQKVGIITGTFANSITAALNYSIIINGVTYNDWYLPSIQEYLLIFGEQNNSYLTDTQTGVAIYIFEDELVSSTTMPNSTTRCFVYYPSVHSIASNQDKTYGLWKATFIRDARNLITAP
jgi:hypothetical protein